jgi:hypothetical protein
MHDPPTDTPTPLPFVTRAHDGLEGTVLAAAESPARQLDGPALVALQLWARGFSLRQIGLLLAANGQQRGTSLDHFGLTALAQRALASALDTLQCASLDEAVVKARQRDLIV